MTENTASLQTTDDPTFVRHALGAPPAGRPPELAAIRQRARRRQAGRAVGGATAAVLVCAMVAALFGLPQAATAPEPQTTSMDIPALRARMAALDTKVTVLEAARPPRYTTITNSVASVDEEIAALLFTAASRYQIRFNRPDKAVQRYQEILASYPDTHAAQRARECLVTIQQPTVLGG